MRQPSGPRNHKAIGRVVPDALVVVKLRIMWFFNGHWMLKTHAFPISPFLNWFWHWSWDKGSFSRQVICWNMWISRASSIVESSQTLCYRPPAQRTTCPFFSNGQPLWRGPTVAPTILYVILIYCSVTTTLYMKSAWEFADIKTIFCNKVRETVFRLMIHAQGSMWIYSFICGWITESSLCESHINPVRLICACLPPNIIHRTTSMNNHFQSINQSINHLSIICQCVG